MECDHEQLEDSFRIVHRHFCDHACCGAGAGRHASTDANDRLPGRTTTITGIATLTAGSCAGAHTHPGLETSYVLEGEIVLKVDGRPDQKYKAGDSFQLPIAAKHDACNPGGAPAKVFVIYVIERGKPVASPAP